MRAKPGTGTRAAPGHAHGPKAPTLRPQARAGAVRPVRPHSPRSRVRRRVARSGPARWWPRSLCTQTPVTVAFAPRGGVCRLDCLWGLRLASKSLRPLHKHFCTLHARGAAGPPLRLRGGARGRRTRGGPSAGRGEVGRGRCGLSRCPAVCARGPSLPPSPASRRRALNRRGATESGPGLWAVSVARAGPGRAWLVAVEAERRGGWRRAGVPGPGVGRPRGSSGRAEAGTTRVSRGRASQAGLNPQLSCLPLPASSPNPSLTRSLSLSHPLPQASRARPSSQPPPPLQAPARPNPACDPAALSPGSRPLPPRRRLAHPTTSRFSRSSPAPLLPCQPPPEPPPLQPSPARPPHSCRRILARTRAPRYPFPGSAQPAGLRRRRRRQLLRGLAGGGSSWLLPAPRACGRPGAPRRGHPVRARAGAPGSSG